MSRRETRGRLQVLARRDAVKVWCPLDGVVLASSCRLPVENGRTRAQEGMDDAHRQLPTGVGGIAGLRRERARIDNASSGRVDQHDVRGCANGDRLSLASEPPDSRGSLAKD